jgi:hypothetical protein
MTCTAIMVSASHCVGFTLPGMIEDPGSFSGIFNSATDFEFNTSMSKTT